MEIRKEYNLKEIMNQLEEEIKGKFNGVFIISPILAQDILDILKEVYRREQKHKIESKESKIPSYFGKYAECAEDAGDCICDFCEYDLNCRRKTNE